MACEMPCWAVASLGLFHQASCMGMALVLRALWEPLFLLLLLMLVLMLLVLFVLLLLLLVLLGPKYILPAMAGPVFIHCQCSI